MIQITISYHKDNDQLAQCKIQLPTNKVARLHLYTWEFLDVELGVGKLIQNKEISTYEFQASKAKIQILEKIILSMKQMMVPLN